jgi:hypothetical protein
MESMMSCTLRETSNNIEGWENFQEIGLWGRMGVKARSGKFSFAGLGAPLALTRCFQIRGIPVGKHSNN